MARVTVGLRQSWGHSSRALVLWPIFERVCVCVEADGPAWSARLDLPHLIPERCPQKVGGWEDRHPLGL